MALLEHFSSIPTTIFCWLSVLFYKSVPFLAHFPIAFDDNKLGEYESGDEINIQASESTSTASAAAEIIDSNRLLYDLSTWRQLRDNLWSLIFHSLLLHFFPIGKRYVLLIFIETSLFWVGLRIRSHPLSWLRLLERIKLQSNTATKNLEHQNQQIWDKP